MSLKKKGIAVFAAAALSVSVAGGVAYAYWSGHGSGVGTAATDTTRPVVINQDPATVSLYPGGSIALKGKIHNPNPVMVRLSGMTGTISVTPLAGKSCPASDYAFTSGWSEWNVQPDVWPNVPASWNGTLTMVNDENRNQDGCKGATVNIAYAAIPLTTG